MADSKRDLGHGTRQGSGNATRGKGEGSTRRVSRARGIRSGTAGQGTGRGRSKGRANWRSGSRGHWGRTGGGILGGGRGVVEITSTEDDTCIESEAKRHG